VVQVYADVSVSDRITQAISDEPAFCLFVHSITVRISAHVHRVRIIVFFAKSIHVAGNRYEQHISDRVRDLNEHDKIDLKQPISVLISVLSYGCGVESKLHSAEISVVLKK